MDELVSLKLLEPIFEIPVKTLRKFGELTKEQEIHFKLFTYRPIKEYFDRNRKKEVEK